MIQAKISIDTTEGTKTRALSIPETMGELTARGFVDILLQTEQWPQWLKKWSDLPFDQQEDEMATWNEEEFAEYFLAMLSVVAAASGTDIDDLRDIPIIKKSVSSGILPMAYKIINAMATYQPKERNEFSFRGKTYVVPGSEVFKIGVIEQRTFMPHERVGTVIEALQRQHIFSAKEPSGAYMLKDRLYYSDLSVIASLAREKKPSGEIEKAPMVGVQEYSDFVDTRMVEFSDIPADVFRDVGFFLLNSSRKRLNTLLSGSFLKGRKKTIPTSKKRPKPWNTGKK